MSQMKIFKSGKLVIFLSTLSLVNVMTWFVTSENAQNGLYPINADSIGLPIMYTLGGSILLLPILFVISLLPNKGLLSWLKSKGTVHRLTVKTGILLLYGLPFLFALNGIKYWSLPEHYSIAASYLVFFLSLFVGLFHSWRELDVYGNED